ncbi:MAG: cytochrome P450 [Chloroflexi bacterium]|nr:cytochrome P450 [Chloroflexota bacterium]
MTSEVDPAKEEAVYKAASVVSELDLMSVDFPDREFEMYRILRQHMPIARQGGTDGGGIFENGTGRGWFFSRYEDVVYAFEHPEIFSSATGLPFIPQAVDPPDHAEYRKIMNPWFAQSVLTPVEPILKELANDLLDKMLEKGEFDFVKEFSEPFPTIIFCQLMGFPLDDVPQMMRWKNLFIHGMRAGKAAELGIATDADGRPQPAAWREVMTKTTQEVYAYFGKMIEERRRHPGDDLVSKLVQAKYAGERPLRDDELLQTLHLFMLGGLDTVTSSLGLIMFFLTTHPEKRREFIELMDDSSRVTAAVEELVRYAAIVSPARRVTRDFSYRGLQLREGDFVILSTPSACRDESVFPNPDEVIFDRHPNPHVAFVVGPHRCLGMQLARRELRIALQEIHRRMPDYALKHGEKAGVYGGGVKGVDYLPLVVAKG